MNLNDFQNFINCGVHIKYIPKVTKLTQNLFTTRTSQKLHKTPFYAFLHNKNS